MQEVIGSTPIFSTKSNTEPDSQLLSNESGSLSAKSLPHSLNCNINSNDMANVTKLFTTPTLFKGKPVLKVPKGSSKSIEQAKLTWYVSFNFLNTDTGNMERIRKTNDLNRIKDPKEKLERGNALVAAYKDLLEGGWNPLDEKANANLKKSIVSITLKEAKELFVKYHEHKGTRKKSIQTYISKIKQFIDHIGDMTKVTEITDYDITGFLYHQEATLGWCGVTFVAARISLNNFFRFLLVKKYIPINPVTLVETRKKIKSEAHKVFSDKDFKDVMDWLKLNDHYTYLFCLALYCTCIRPKELRYLQLKHIDFKSNTITIPTNVAKNKKAIPVTIDAQLLLELDKLNLSIHNPDHYLFGSTKTIISINKIGENTPYNRFQECLKTLKLLNKGYTMYSIKHLSNVRKFIAGWTVAEICRANRHSSLVETENYLRDLTKFVDTNKAVPFI